MDGRTPIVIPGLIGMRKHARPSFVLRTGCSGSRCAEVDVVACTLRVMCSLYMNWLGLKVSTQISATCTLPRAQRVTQPGRLPVTPLPPLLSLNQCEG